MLFPENNYSCSSHKMTIHVLETQQTHQNSETKTKTKATNLRLNRSNPYEKKKKKSKPINPLLGYSIFFIYT